MQSATAEIRRGKKEERRRRKKKPWEENIISASATQGGHKEYKVYTFAKQQQMNCRQTIQLIPNNTGVKLLQTSDKTEHFVFVHDADEPQHIGMIQAS